jgi:hypothetical protein
MISVVQSGAVAALLLFAATSTSTADPANQSSPSAIEPEQPEQPMCSAEMGTAIPCDQLGVAYDCGQGPSKEGELDEVWIKHSHALSDLSFHTITIYTPLRQSRNGRRYPVFNYDLETHEITLDGKPCHPVGG